MYSAETKIYIAGQRGCTQSNWFRSMHTFSFGEYQHDHKKPFLSLYGFNEETLKSSCTFTHVAVENTYLLLLPTIGAIEVQFDRAASEFVQTGEFKLIYVPAASEVRIKNPYEGELVNYLTTWISSSQATGLTSKNGAFDLDIKKNSLEKLLSFELFTSYIGKFTGRTDYTFHVNAKTKGIFAYIIEGAFEFKNRLLQPKDALTLAYTPTLEFESLSNDAIILMVELRQ